MEPDRLVLKPRRKRPLPAFRTLGCAVTKSRTQWCYGICRPVKGIGQCGRLYPHHLKGRTQLAIARYKVRKAIESSGPSGP
jgi:hypothetical protein